MATVDRERLREVLEEAMEDVAMLMSDELSREARLKDVRSRIAKVWTMAELGDVPEWETQVRAKRVS